MQQFSYKTEKTIETRDGWTRREKNTCRERFKGNVGLHTSTVQSHRQSDTNRSHKNTHTTHTEIISCDNKILCKEEEHKYTNLVLQRGCKEECVWERCFAPKEKCGSGRARAGMRSKNKPPKQKHNEESGKGRNEGREREEEHEEEEKDTFEIFFL